MGLALSTAQLDEYDRRGCVILRSFFDSGTVDSLRRADAIDIDGFALRYGEGDNQGSDEVFLTVIGSDGEYHPVDTLHETAIWVTR